MSNFSSSNLTTLDFDSIKNNLKQYLKSQDNFKDYDFEGSNMSVLLDILAHNTYLNSFYLNMIGNEMFLDRAILRDSVVSHAKELNYVPRSFRSSTANVNITIVDSVASSVVIPKGTSFTGTLGNRNFSFVTTQNIQVGGSNNTFRAENVLLSEGSYITDTYVMNYQSQDRFVITNKTVDTNTITVTVIEDNGSVFQIYNRATSLFGLNSVSKVFFIQGAENESYEIVFGDNVIGRKPKDNSVIIIEYVSCNGELPNGINRFIADGPIGTGIVSSIEVNSPATGGSIYESLSSIKFNAPRAFTTQERAVTASDYEILLKSNFSDINEISAFGGEEMNPPQFGKVIIAVDLKGTNVLPLVRRQEFQSFIKARSPLAIDPIFISPQYTYVKVVSNVKYNINSTSLNKDDIKTLVTDTIQTFNFAFLNGFNKTLYKSKFDSAIDDSHFSIISNNTEIFAVKLIEPLLRIEKNYVIDFNIPLRDDLSGLNPNEFVKISTVQSTSFIFNGIRCIIEDDGRGNLFIVSGDDLQKQIIKETGTVDYSTGILKINNFRPELLENNQLEFNVRTKDNNISSTKSTVLDIRDTDINVFIEQVRI
jgi:hypothetical protein